MDEEFNKYRSEVDFTLYLENTKIADFEYRFDELIKFMQRWKTDYPIDEDLQIGTEKALKVIWHPITRPYTVFARFLPETLKDNGRITRDPKNTFEFMSVNWFQVGNRLKLIFTHESWFFVFPPLFYILGAIGKDWQETRRDIENYHIKLTGQPFPIDTAQADARKPEIKELPSEIMQIDKVSKNPTLQQALVLYIFSSESTLAAIAKEKNYKNQNSLATLVSSVRKELIQQYGDKRANELLPHRKSNSSWRKTR